MLYSKMVVPIFAKKLPQFIFVLQRNPDDKRCLQKDEKPANFE